MIFVTVGTHEQQFNRLVQYMDEWAKKHEEVVVIQTGYSTYEPKYATWKKLVSYADMNRYIEEARIIISHGGPSSFVAPLQMGKIPIVVPRQKCYGEHVNNHQLRFAKEVEKRNKNIIVVDDIDRLEEAIDNYSKFEAIMDKGTYNNKSFCENLEKSVDFLFS